MNPIIVAKGYRALLSAQYSFAIFHFKIKREENKYEKTKKK